MPNSVDDGFMFKMKTNMMLLVLAFASLWFVNTEGRNVSATDCSSNATICAPISNSACVNNKCKCNDGYKETNATCTAVFGSQCTGAVACPGLTNSLCADNKCGCAAGFAEKNNLCVTESGAVSVTSAVGLLFGSLLILLIAP